MFIQKVTEDFEQLTQIIANKKTEIVNRINESFNVYIDQLKNLSIGLEALMQSL